MKRSAKTADSLLVLKLLFIISLVLPSLAFSKSVVPGSKTPLVPDPYMRPAELILKNARIYTDHDTNRSWSSALSIRDGNIQTIGDDAHILKEAGPTTRVIDLKGRVVMPGFNDTNVDFFSDPSLLGDSPDTDALKQNFLAMQDQAIEHGVTSLQGSLHLPSEISVIKELYDSKKIRIRISAFGKLENLKEHIALKEKYADLPEEWIRFDSVMAHVDGEIKTKSAAVEAPYSDDTNIRGELLFEQDTLNELVLNANRVGVPVILKASGDRAIAMALTAIIQAKQKLFNSRIRNRIENIELAANHLYPKFTTYNVVASMKPNELVFENETKNFFSKSVPKDRIKNVIPVKNFIQARSHIAFSSGWPNSPINPLLGIWGAVFRLAQNAKPFGGWSPSQKITLEQAFEIYTLGSAYSTREEHVKGSLREGKYADMVVFEQDPFKNVDQRFLKIPVYMTIANGKIVYDGTVAQIKALPD